MPNLNNDILRKNMKQLIDDRGVNQKQLEAELHITQSTISKYITGKQPISLNFLYIFAQHFNVTMDSLCQEPINEPPIKVEEADDDEFPPLPPIFTSSDRVITICTALADIFKYGNLKTEKIEKYEAVYREDEQSGLYYRAKGTLGVSDPANKYTSLYFSNYWDVATAFSNDDEYHDYMLELEQSGNYNELNGAINAFLEKLTDLYTIYLRDSLTPDAYNLAIEKNLQQLINEQKRK